MGQSLSEYIEDFEEKANDKEKFQEALKLRKIERTMRQTLEANKARLYIDALNDECIPIICAVDKFYEFLVKVEKVTATPETVDRYDIGKRLKKHLHGDYLTELITLLEGVLENVLVMQTTGVIEENQTHVVYANRSVIRIDYYFYYTKIFVGGVVVTVLSYYVQVGVIDMTRVRLPVLIYELTRATEDGQLKKAGDELKDIAVSTKRLHEAVKILSDAAFSTYGSTTNTNPPTGPVPLPKNPGAGPSGP